MDGVAKRELTEVEMILGKGMLYDSSGLTELVNMYYLRYGIIIEVVWYPNLKKWLPNVRTIAYTPKEVGNKKLVNTICIIALVIKVVVLERKIKDCNDTIIDNRKVIRNNSILIEKSSEILKVSVNDIKRIVDVLTSHITDSSKHN